MSLSVSFAHLDAIPLAVVRRRARRAELGAVVQRGCGEVWNYIRAQNLRGGRHVAVYLSAAIDLEVGVELASQFIESDDVVRSHTPAGLAASVTQFGPYQALGAAHEAIRAWCKANGHQLAGPNWEIYGHWLPEWNADPSKIQTDVFYQVAQP